MMSLGHIAVKRQGSPKAIGRDEGVGYFRIQILLNISPDRDWIECFKNPSKYRPDEAHPKLSEIQGNVLVFWSSEGHIKENVEWIDEYINQANECYHRKMAEKEARIKGQEEKTKKEKEELQRINKMLEKL